MTQEATHTVSGLTIRGFTAILTGISAVIWMGTSIFVPGLPEIGRELAMDYDQLSLALTYYYLSFAVLMPVVGPLSDAWGRRGFVLAGLGLFTLGSIGCAMADSGGMFYAGRIVQGLGVGMVQVPTLAMVRDECPGPESYTMLGLLGALTGIIPVLAMLVGGLIIQYADWRFVFHVLAAAGVCGMIACRFAIPETLPPNKRKPSIDLGSDIAIYRRIVFSRQVGLVTMPLLFNVVFHGAFLVIAPYGLASEYGLTPSQFGVANIFIVGSMALGQFLATRAVKRHAPQRLYPLGGLSALIGGGLFVALYLFSALDSVVIFMLPLVIFAFCFGFMEPIGLKSLFARFDKTSGMASAVYGTLLLILQGMGSFTAGLLMDSSFSPAQAMALMLCPLGLAIFCLSMMGRSRIE